MSATITIVRHGDTFAPGDPPRRIGARTDPPLVPSGRAQAAALAAAFATMAFDRAATSPLARTRETAAAILAAQAAAPALEVAGWLAEIDHGPDEGLVEAAVVERIGEAALAAWDERAEPPAGWIVDAPARIAAWRQLYARIGADERLLAVTSNGAARFALIAAGLRPPGGFKLRTGAYGTIRVVGGIATLDVWNVRP